MKELRDSYLADAREAHKRGDKAEYFYLLWLAAGTYEYKELDKED